MSSRAAFNAYDQLARIGLVWLTFVGAAMALRQRLNIVVDLFGHRLPPGAATLRALILDALAAAVACLLVTYAWRLMAIGGYQRVVGTPFTYLTVYTSLFVGSILFVVFLLARIIATFLSHRRNARS